MNTLWIVLIAVAVIYMAYNFYARKIDRNVIQADAKRATPAKMYMDGVDFMPTSKNVLYGYHFKSIAAAGPIVGVITAANIWGWLPSLLWLVIGVSFIGWASDYSAIMVAVRNDGNSLSAISHRLIAPRTRTILFVFIFFYLMLLAGAFVGILAAILSAPARRAVRHHHAGADGSSRRADDVPLEDGPDPRDGHRRRGDDGGHGPRAHGPAQGRQGRARARGRSAARHRGVSTAPWTNSLASSRCCHRGPDGGRSAYPGSGPDGKRATTAGLRCRHGAHPDDAELPRLDGVPVRLLLSAAPTCRSGASLSRSTTSASGSCSSRSSLAPSGRWWRRSPGEGPGGNAIGAFALSAVKGLGFALAGGQGVAAALADALRDHCLRRDLGLACAGRLGRYRPPARVRNRRPPGRRRSMFGENTLALLSLVAVSIAGVGGGGGRFAAGVGKLIYAGTFGALPEVFGTALGFGAFVMIVLTVTQLVFRVMRVTLTEWVGETVPLVRNMHVSSIISMVLTLALVLTGTWVYLWQMFGASNQLMAALSLLVVTVWLKSENRNPSYAL